MGVRGLARGKIERGGYPTCDWSLWFLGQYFYGTPVCVCRTVFRYHAVVAEGGVVVVSVAVHGYLYIYIPGMCVYVLLRRILSRCACVMGVFVAGSTAKRHFNAGSRKVNVEHVCNWFGYEYTKKKIWQLII